MERDDIKIVDDEEYAETVLAQVEGIIKKGTRENVGQLFDALSVRHRSERDVLEVKSIFLLPRGGSVIRQRPQPNPNLKVSNSRTSQIKAGSSEKTQGGASFSASVFNLVNNVAGAGILTLAAGKASGTGWIPSIFICSTLAALSAHTFTLIGHACELSGERDFAGLWSRAFGKETAYLVSLVVSLQGTASQIIYAGMIGDVFSALFKMVGVTSMDRTKCIVLIATTALWPMCLLRNLSAMAFTSILGFSAVMYTVFFIVVRALDGSYSVESGGRFVSSMQDLSLLVATPSFAKSSLWNVDFTSLVLVSNLGLAYIAHYNAPSYWSELQHNKVPGRFASMVRVSYAILTTIYLLAMCAGYYTFGDVCMGNILLNYHPGDILSTLGRLATGFSIVFGFPLVHNGAREGLKSFTSSAFGWRSLSDPKNHVLLATAYLTVVSTIAILVKDVRLVVGLAGAAFGSFLVYICPVLVYLRILQNIQGPDSMEYKRAKNNNLLLIPFGIFCGSMGVAMTLKEAMNRAVGAAASLKVIN